jgi:hypothetical protein
MYSSKRYSTAVAYCEFPSTECSQDSRGTTMAAGVRRIATMKYMRYILRMNLFLSWSGTKSLAVAEILKKYLPSMINQVEPWLSSEQIDAGGGGVPKLRRT